ncbi:MAG: RNA methyltransferase [Bacteroidota bacterium]
MRKLSIDELNRISVADFKTAPKVPVTVILDNVRSMHNVGSVLRTSDAFRVEKVYCCGITPTPPHREIRKTAIGAEESVDWEKREDTLTLIQELKGRGYTILSIEQVDESLSLSSFETDPKGKYAVVLGHEIQGVSDAVITLSDYAIEIPQFGTKHSLNISVAAGIVLYKLILEGIQPLQFKEGGTHE